MANINQIDSAEISLVSGTQKISPFLWFDNQAEEAANFYTSLFHNSKIKMVSRYGDAGADVSGQESGSVMTVAFQIESQDFIAINGGPIFKVSPTISFFVNIDSHQEIERLWSKLSEEGTVFMELNSYPFSEKYGWIQDKFGVSWQLIHPGRSQKITPCFMFTGEQHKKAEEAIQFYLSVFKNSGIIMLEHYQKGQGPEGGVVHCRFTLNGQEFTAMDSHESLPYAFNPGISMVVDCKTQEEVDYYWSRLSEGGAPEAQQCGWLADKYGVSWQIVPDALGELLSDPDPKKSAKVMEAMLQMKKIDIAALRNAYNQ